MSDETMIDVEAVAIPTSVACDLIAALSAENVRLRADLMRAEERAKEKDEYIAHLKAEVAKWRDLWLGLRNKADKNKAEKRRQTIARKQEGEL